MQSPAPERNIKLVLEYDGKAFYGFQRQPNHLTVQEVLESALSRLFNRPVKIQAASGRTDTGVHAEGQVVNFRIASPLSCEAVQKALNGILPGAVAVRQASNVPEDFHARFSASGKTYEYRIWNSRVRSPLLADKTCHVTQPLDIAKMRKAAAYLKGRHDFRSFCAEDPSKKGDRNTIRTIRRFTVGSKGSQISIRIEADGFLYRMVRNLAGVLVEAGSGRITPLRVKEILELKDRRQAPKTMPPQGLTLVSVIYSKNGKKRSKRE